MEKAGIGGVLLALAAFVLPVAASGAPTLTADDLRVGGYTDFGRFQLSDAESKGADGEIVSRLGARWRLDKPINENFSAMADLHWMFWRNQATDIQLFHIAGLKFDSDVQAALSWVSGRGDGVGGQRAKIGLYDVKYNRDSRNLGEYLLRSEAYPTILESSQGKDLLKDSHARILGAEYGRREAPLFGHSVLLYAEQYSQPVYDLNVAYLATFGTGKAHVGAGVAWARFVKLSESDSNTTMPADHREYIRGSGLTTSALKFSVRGRAELLAFPGEDEGLVVYGEAALLGTKSDTLYYKNIGERIPVMAGISLPVPRVFNTLAVEVEYFRNPYGDKRYEVRYAPTPLPVLDDYSVMPDYTKDDLRWSVQAHRALNRWLDVKLRVASDHLRLRSWDGDYGTTSPMTRSSRDWYFLARVEFHN